MTNRWIAVFCLAGCAAGALEAQSVIGPLVQFQTNLGNINVEMLPNTAPKTVANFLQYVNAGSYTNSIFHRSVVSGIYIIQGGGYQLVNNLPVAIAQNAPIVDEFHVSNIRGTLAMAQLSNQPNSATNEWFFNTQDNSASLDTQGTNPGFAVFGQVADAASLAVMDAIQAVPTYDLSGDPAWGSAFTNLPLQNYNGNPSQVTSANVVLVKAITQVISGPQPQIAANGVIMASAYGGYQAAAPGTFIEIYGSNLAGTTREWNGSDFNGGAAPTELDNVTVMIGGQPGYVSYVSPTQVNAEVPAGVPVGGYVSVQVTYNGQPSPPVNLVMYSTQGGILAPASFNVKGKQYVAAFHLDNTMVTNGSIPGVSGRPAARGETIVFYGLGFGPVNPPTVPYTGQIAEGQSTLVVPVQFQFGPNNLNGTMVYQGMAPGLTGLDQFDVTVPSNTPSGDVALTVSQGQAPIGQSLYIPIQ